MALTPPAAAVDELVAATADVRAAFPGLRWTPPGQWHVTLAFLGEVDDRAHADVAERLGRAATRHSPLTLSFGPAGRFGDRVLWARVRGDVEPLRGLVASVRAAARRARIAVEDRPYRPHVTLARSRDPAAVLRPAVAALAGFSGRDWAATELHLVRSHLRAEPVWGMEAGGACGAGGAGKGGGARHETITSWPLGRR